MTKIPDDVKDGIARIIDPGAWDSYAEEGSQMIAARRQIVARSKVDKILAFIVAAVPSPYDTDFAAIGRSTMKAIETITTNEGPFKNWTPAEDPAEIIADLYEALSDAAERIAIATAVLNGRST